MKQLVLSVAMVFLCGMGLSIMPTGALAVPVDLNEFYPEGDVSIAPDGSEATLQVQDPDLGYTLLANDPLWDDPGINVGADALSLSFGYEFFEEYGNDTEVYVRLLDGHNGDLLDDFLLVGDGTLTGTHTFDLTTILAGQTLLGLDFTITEYSLDADVYYNLGSSVTISNLDLAVQKAAPIPEPSTIMLLCTGLVALGSGLRKTHRKMYRT